MPCIKSETILKLRKRKVILSLGTALVVTFLIVFIANSTNSKELPSTEAAFHRDNELELKLVHAVISTLFQF